MIQTYRASRVSHFQTYSVVSHQQLLHDVLKNMQMSIAAHPQQTIDICKAPCSGYHVGWIALQCLDLISGLSSERAWIAQDLRRLHATHPLQNCLIVGSADFGILSILHEALGAAIQDIEVTVSDRCHTPLELCQKYASHFGFRIHVQQGDLLDMDCSRRYDLIIGHSILSFLNPSMHAKWVAQLGSCLARQGVLILYQSIRVGYDDHILQYDRAEIVSLIAHAQILVQTGGEREGLLTMAEASDIVEAFCAAKKTFALTSSSDIENAFRQAQLTVESHMMLDSKTSNHKEATPRTHFQKFAFMGSPVKLNSGSL
jgi:hypothetical protein